MAIELFHADNCNFFDIPALRYRAGQIVRGSPLVCRAEQGDKAAAVALMIGFWPFVSEFELAIDAQTLPRLPLAENFGEPRVRRVFGGIARAVRDMKQEEGSHAAHWMRDAQCLGINDFAGPSVDAIQALINRSYTRDLPFFFATLAGTELIAEELSRFLVASSRFTELFSRRQWMWGEMHLLADDDGVSHLEIDLDLARAYRPQARPAELALPLLDTMLLFGRAGDEVMAELVPALAA
jgi:hypothetical protein